MLEGNTHSATKDTNRSQSVRMAQSKRNTTSTVTYVISILLLVTLIKVKINT
jgi:hypothetical protein